MDEVYKKLDLSKIRHSKILSSEEALMDITPFDYDAEVYTGEKKVVIDNQGIHYALIKTS